MSEYASPSEVTTLRVYQEPDGSWSLDGTAPDGRYTESCWNFDTEKQAEAARDEFATAAGLTQFTTPDRAE